MVVKLLTHEHGKGRVRLLKVTRAADKHTVLQLEAEILLEGPAERAYYNGDNSNVLPTDSVKNTVYVLAKQHEFETIEDFAIILAKHFVATHPQIVDVAKVKLFETHWERVVTADSTGKMRPHHHAFVGVDSGIATTSYVPPTVLCVVYGYVLTRRVCVSLHGNSAVARKAPHGGEPLVSLSAGIDGWRVMKTTQSSFVDFFRDAYTTLPDVPDRLVGTVVQATWTFTSEAFRSCFKAQREQVKKTLLDAFAGPSDVGVPSDAVQATLFQMGEAVLAKCPFVKDITILMPNVHNLPVDLTRFGLKNLHPHGEVFLPTSEPHGIIKATMVRATSRL